MLNTLRQTQSVGLLATVSIAAIAVSTTLVIWGLRDREIEHARQATGSLAQMVMDQTKQSFEGADLLLQGVQERLSNTYGKQFALDSAPTHLLLSARASGLRQLKSLYLVDAQGTVVNSSDVLARVPRSVAQRTFFKSLARELREPVYFDNPQNSFSGSNWELQMARPLYFPDGRFRGVVVAQMNIAQIERMFRGVKLDYERPISLYLSDGTLVASSALRTEAIGQAAPELSGIRLPGAVGEVRFVRRPRPEGGVQLLTLARLEKYPLLVGIEDDESQSLASWSETAVPIGVGAALVCLFTGAMAIFLMGQLSREEVMARALRLADGRYHHTVDSVMDAIVAIDGNFAIRLFNPAAERMFGLRSDEVLGRTMDILLPERLRSVHIKHLQGYQGADNGSRAMAPSMAIFGQHADGSEFPIESTISRSEIGGELQMTAVLRDVSAQRQAEHELRDVNQQLRKLSSNLQSVREEERTRIARELHDELGQQLTGLKLSLSWFTGRFREGRGTSVESLDDMRHGLDNAIASVRRISSELRPPILDDLGFADALAWHCREFAKRSELALVLELPAAHDVHDDKVCMALYRIVQESLTNVARHAQASAVHISMVEVQGQVLLRIVDNGRGLRSDTVQNGVGLVSMRERAMAIGATFRIQGDPGQGVSVQVSLPLPTATESAQQ